jgi:hypothetical protein
VQRGYDRQQRKNMHVMLAGEHCACKRMCKAPSQDEQVQQMLVGAELAALAARNQSQTLRAAHIVRWKWLKHARMQTGSHVPVCSAVACISIWQLQLRLPR